MLIQVTEEGFVWVSPTGKKQVTQQLWGPQHCRYERLQIVRDGKVIDEAEIRTVGAGASYEGFEGLEKIAGPGRYRETLELRLFQVGDELRISDLPAKLSELDYWQELSLGKTTELAA
jgi:hypothetical protein